MDARSLAPGGPPRKTAVFKRILYEDEYKAITLSATDEDGDGLTFKISSPPTSGTLGDVGSVTCEETTKACQADITYMPNPDFNGDDSFGFSVNDGIVDSNEATVSVNVSPVNDVLSFKGGADQTFDEDAGAQTVNGFASNISAGPSDESS